MLPSPFKVGLQAKIEKAVHIIEQFNGAVVALSAGVDSSLVAALARKALGDRVAAVTAVSESLADLRRFLMEPSLMILEILGPDFWRLRRLG